MKKEKWIESEKEYQLVNNEWIEIKKKSIQVLGVSQRTREIWDIVFKFFAAIAIFSPFLILVLQNSNEYNRQKKIKLSDLYSDVLSDLRIFKIITSRDSSNRELAYKIHTIYPVKLALDGNSQITNMYDSVRQELAIIYDLYKLKFSYSGILDAIYKFEEFSDKVSSDGSLHFITYNKFRKDSVAFVENITELDDQISRGVYYCEEMLKCDPINFDTSNFNQIRQVLIPLNSKKKFSDELWDSLMNFQSYKKILITTSNKVHIQAMEVLKENADKYLKFCDSVFQFRREKLQMLFVNQIKL